MSSDVDFSEAKCAYKGKALDFHPDKNQDDPSITEKFQAINEAWERIQRARGWKQDNNIENNLKFN
ncbi:MAG: J domain-containing protein [Puniceicoccales bacterium]|nr:J domain-containing protein [Puniceicoccales bacterium]